MTLPMAVLAAPDPSLITVGGLPLHPLAVHAVVVLLPLSIMGLIAMILRPAWRATYGWLVMLGLLAGTAATAAAVKGGEQLAVLTGISDEHRNLGTDLLYVAAALLVFAAWWMLQRRIVDRDNARRDGAGRISRTFAAVAGTGSIVLGVGALGLSALVGHSGANAVWESKIAAAPTASATPSATAVSYALTDVQAHTSATDCWSVVDAGVFNLSEWINKHPGGGGVIQGMCGVDATAAFSAKHSGSQRAKDFLASYKIGSLTGGAPSATPSTTTTPSATATPTTPAKPSTTLTPSSTPKPTKTPTKTPKPTTPAGSNNSFTLAGVQAHAKSSDCWSIVSGNIYNLTSWVSKHPGGSGVITSMCGVDASAAFNGKHGGQSNPVAVLGTYLLGALKG